MLNSGDIKLGLDVNGASNVTKLGEGTSSSVLLAHVNGQPCAIKRWKIRQVVS